MVVSVDDGGGELVMFVKDGILRLLLNLWVFNQMMS